MRKFFAMLFLIMSIGVSAYAQSPQDLDLSVDWVRLPDTVVREITPDSPFLMEQHSYLTVDIGVPAGSYVIAMSYMSLNPILGRNNIVVSVDDFSDQVPVISVWADESKVYEQDRFGNDILPRQITIQEFHTEYLVSNVTLSRQPLIFNLDENSELTIQSLDNSLLIQSIFVLEVHTAPPFEETAQAAAPLGSDVIIIEGENHVVKSHSFIGSVNEQNPAIYPFELERRLLNAAHFNRLGEKLVWRFYVDTPGRYRISFRYAQWALQEMEVYRNILINGQIPSAEFINLPFTYTGVPNTFSNKTADSYIFLEAGWNTIAMQSDAAILMPYYMRLRHIQNSLNEITTELRRLANITGTAHRHRTWAVEQYMPGITQRLTDYSEELTNLVSEIPRLSERNPAPLTVLLVSASQLDRLVERIDRLPANLNRLSDVTLVMADLVGSLMTQPMLLDRIYIHPDNFELPPARLSFFQSLGHSIREFFHALLRVNQDLVVAGRQDEDEVVVWVSRPIHIVEMMQQMIDSGYTPETGQRVRLSVITDPQRLILSNASGTNPDAALGISAHIPFEFALRGAVADLTQFPDFIPFVREHFVPETFQAFVFEDGIYALPETKNVFMMFYRQDILEHLGLAPPDTWDDVRAMMPVLRRNAMNFFIPLSQGVGFKPFFGTAPFIFQMEADLYTPDGMATAMHTPNSLEAFELMTDLFRIYALQDNVPSFYQSFRMGTIPVGVADLNQLIQFRVAAPEIDGLWNIELAPGAAGSDGVIRRYQLAAQSTCIILSTSEKQEQAWDFLKWWMSTEIQTEFGFNMVYRLGPEFVWGSANIQAFATLPFTAREREVILGMWEWIREVPRHPASYIVERELSNAWFATVGDNVPSRIALDTSMTIANREITRRLEEFGYVENGVPVRDFIIRPIHTFLGGYANAGS